MHLGHLSVEEFLRKGEYDQGDVAIIDYDDLYNYLHSAKLKPNKSVEAPPYQVTYDFPPLFKCFFGHQFEWKVTPMGQWRQEICKKCGITRHTEKLTKI